MANFYTDNPDLRHHLNHPMMRKIVELKERDYTDAEKFDYAPLNFEDAMDNYDRVLEVVGELCGDIIAPNAESVDHEGASCSGGRAHYASATVDNLEACRQAGLMGMAMPRRFGGLNFPITPYIMAADIVSRADTGFENLWGLQDCAETLYEFGDEDQKARFIPRVCEGETMSMDLTEPDAGSDLQSVMLKATQNEDGTWVLNGVKRFITNGDADLHLVLARSEEGTKDGRGLSMFIYDKRNGGVTVRRIENKMGIKGSPTCELAYREALAYARDRRQFGKAIIEFPAVAEMIAVMKAKLDASRSLLYECARYVDLYKVLEDIAKERRLTPEERAECKHYNRIADALTPMAKGMGSEYCNQNAYDCIQVHGGSGFMKDYACERLYRDARITSIYEGTTQLQVVAAIRHVTTGTYNNLIEEYAKNEVRPELQGIKDRLAVLTEMYTKAVAAVAEVNDPVYTDFMARRMVEMAGNIVMGYLLLLDANRTESFTKSAQVYVNLAAAEVTRHAEFINTFDRAQLAAYLEH